MNGKYFCLKCYGKGKIETDEMKNLKNMRMEKEISLHKQKISPSEIKDFLKNHFDVKINDLIEKNLAYSECPRCNGKGEIGQSD